MSYQIHNIKRVCKREINWHERQGKGGINPFAFNLILELAEETDGHFEQVLAVSYGKDQTIKRLEGTVEIAHQDQRLLTEQIKKLKAEREAGWGTLRAAREDFRKEQRRKEASLTKRRQQVYQREAALKKATPSQRERFTTASEDTALTLNKIMLVLIKGLDLDTGDMLDINAAIEDVYEEKGQRK
jgi:hypothetical protein